MDQDISLVVSWRDYVDIVIEREVGVLVARIHGIEAARTLQAMELARRLEELNHAHQQALDDRAEFVLRSEFHELKRQFEQFRDQTASILAHHRGRDSVVYAVIGFLVAAGIALIHYWSK